MRVYDTTLDAPYGAAYDTAYGTAASETAFLPTDLVSLEEWYDVQTGLTDSGGTVTGWSDRSSNSYSLSVAGNPQTGADTINSLPTVTFDGAGDALSVTSVTYSNSHTVVLVAHCVAANGDNNESVFSADGGSQDYQVRNANTTECRYSINGIAGSAPTVDQVGATRIVSIEYDAAGGNATCYIDGVMASQNTSFLGVISATKTIIGANRPMNTYWDGYVADLVHFNEADSDNRQKVEGYLAHKFALTGSLSAGHPYKSAPP